LWFWDGAALGVGSFRQKLFSLEVGIARIRGSMVRVGHADIWPWGMGSMRNSGA